MKSNNDTRQRRKVGSSRRTLRPSAGEPSVAALETGNRGADQRVQALDQPFDSLNRAIINLLQEDGRLSFAKIAETLDVSEGTVRNRVNRMTEAKVLRIMAVADPLALGYTGYAMLAMRLGPNADPESVAKRFAEREEVTYVVLVAGRYDLLVEVICEDHKELRDFIFKHCYHHPDIASVEPMMALAMYKNLLKWGQP